MTGAACAAQEAAPAGPVANPGDDGSVKAQLTRYEKNMVAAADSMPAEKIQFQADAGDEWPFGHVVMHIAQSNYFLCSEDLGSGGSGPETDGCGWKDKLGCGAEGFV